MTMTPERARFDDTMLAELRRDMLRFASLQLRDDHLAEDVVQDAMAAALAGGQEFAGKSSVKTWVFAILKNKIIDVIRQRGRTINVTALSPQEQSMDQGFEALFKTNQHWKPDHRPSDWGDPEQALRHSQFMAVLEACLSHLPENTARVFMMREFLALDTTEVCAELAISTSNCHVILHRARNGLRECLEKNWFVAGERA
jgi:RNA polymerase sigma-70 factor (TIGR02943 family)